MRKARSVDTLPESNDVRPLEKDIGDTNRVYGRGTRSVLPNIYPNEERTAHGLLVWSADFRGGRSKCCEYRMIHAARSGVNRLEISSRSPNAKSKHQDRNHKLVVGGPSVPGRQINAVPLVSAVCTVLRCPRIGDIPSQIERQIQISE